MSSTPGHIYVAEVASRVGRSAHTLRMWTQRPDFPDHLKPSFETTGRKRAFWIDAQIPGLKDFAAARDKDRGSFGRNKTG